MYMLLRRANKPKWTPVQCKVHLARSTKQTQVGERIVSQARSCEHPEVWFKLVVNMLLLLPITLCQHLPHLVNNS